MIEHILERRTRMLADKIRHRIEVYKDMLRPHGGKPPWTKQLTNEEALVFWRKHRYSELGGRLLSGMSKRQVLQLDQWLAQHPDPTIARATLPTMEGG
jgi:hypothetical protein